MWERLAIEIQHVLGSPAQETSPQAATLPKLKQGGPLPDVDHTSSASVLHLLLPFVCSCSVLSQFGAGILMLLLVQTRSRRAGQTCSTHKDQPPTDSACAPGSEAPAGLQEPCPTPCIEFRYICSCNLIWRTLRFTCAHHTNEDQQNGLNSA